MSNTVRLHRVLKTTPEKLYRAFIEPAALAKWLPPHGFTCTVHELDAKVGGRFRMSFTNFGANAGHSFGGTYLELVPHSLIRYNDQFDDPSLPGIIEVRVEIAPSVAGAELRIEQSNLPPQIPVDLCYLGWQESLEQLARLVEPEIPAGA